MSIKFALRSDGTDLIFTWETGGVNPRTELEQKGMVDPTDHIEVISALVDIEYVHVLHRRCPSLPIMLRWNGFNKGQTYRGDLARFLFDNIGDK